MVLNVQPWSKLLRGADMNAKKIDLTPTAPNLRLTMNLEVDDSRLKCGNKKGRTISEPRLVFTQRFYTESCYTENLTKLLGNVNSFLCY